MPAVPAAAVPAAGVAIVPVPAAVPAAAMPAAAVLASQRHLQLAEMSASQALQSTCSLGGVVVSTLAPWDMASWCALRNSSRWPAHVAHLQHMRDAARPYAVATGAAARTAGGHANSVRQLAAQQQQAGVPPAVAAELQRCVAEADQIALYSREQADVSDLFWQIMQAASDPLLQLAHDPVSLEQRRGQYSDLQDGRSYPADLAADEEMRPERQRIYSLVEPVSAIAVEGMPLSGSILVRMGVLQKTSASNPLVSHLLLALETLQPIEQPVLQAMQQQVRQLRQQALQRLQQEAQQLRQQELQRLQLEALLLQDDPDGNPWPQQDDYWGDAPGAQQQGLPVAQLQPAGALGGLVAAAQPQGGPQAGAQAGAQVVGAG